MLGAGCHYNYADSYQKNSAYTANYATWYGPSALPAIASDITIEGNGATINRSAPNDDEPSIPRSESYVVHPEDHDFRLFFVGADPDNPNTWHYTTPGAGKLTLRDVTVSGGHAEGGDSGSGGAGAGLGGAIYNQGQVVIEGSTLVSNLADGGDTAQAYSEVAGGPVIVNLPAGGGIGTDPLRGPGGGFVGGGFGGVGHGGVGHGGALGFKPEPHVSHSAGGGGAGFRTNDNGELGKGGGAATGLAGAGRGDYAVATNTSSPGHLAGNGGGGGTHVHAPCPGNGGMLGAQNDNGGDFGNGGNYEAGNFAGGGGAGGGGGGFVPGYNETGCFYGAPFLGAGGGFGGGGGAAEFAGGSGGFGGGGAGGASTLNQGGFGGGAGSGDSSLDTGGAGAGMGGAIFNHQGSVTIRNSTLSGNTATGGNRFPLWLSGPIYDGKGLGGAIFNLNGSVALDSSTLADNNAQSDGGAIYNLGYMADDTGDPGGHKYTAHVDLTNSIVTDSVLASHDIVSNAPAKTDGEVADRLDNTVTGAGDTAVDMSDHNIVGAHATEGAGETTGSPSAADPQLGPLADNGGTTKTYAITDSSSAFGAGKTTLTVDQRGEPRPSGAADDIGAFELSAVTADAKVSLSRSPAAVDVGDPVTYTVTASNAGPDPAAASIVSLTFSSAVDFSAADSDSRCDFAGNVVTCDLDTLTKGAPKTFTVVVSPQVSGTLTATAGVATATADSDSTNNSATVDVAVNDVVVVPSADARVSLSRSPAAVDVGDRVTYSVTASNAGPDPATTSVVSLTFSSAVDFDAAASDDRCDFAGNVVTCDLDTLTKGAPKTFTVVVSPQVSGTLTATAGVATATADSDSTNNSATADVTVTDASTGTDPGTGPDDGSGNSPGTGGSTPGGSFDPSHHGALPDTGGPDLRLFWTGLGAVAMGSLLLFVARRRRGSLS